MTRLLVLNGPNLNLLGLREPEIYGKADYRELVRLLEEHCRAAGVEVECCQSNHEGVLVDLIQKAYGSFDGIIINPAAYTHTSIALLDALKAVALPAVEVHISNLNEREAFRQISYVRQACLATVSGKGLAGYLEAVDLILAALARRS